MALFLSLPMEIIIQILFFVDYRSLFRHLIHTCNYFRTIIESHDFQMHLLHHDFKIVTCDASLLEIECTKRILIRKHVAATILENIILKNRQFPFTICSNMCMGQIDKFLFEKQLPTDQNVLQRGIVSLYYDIHLDPYYHTPHTIAAWLYPVLEAMEYCIPDFDGSNFKTTTRKKWSVYKTYDQMKYDRYFILKEIKRFLCHNGLWSFDHQWEFDQLREMVKPSRFITSDKRKMIVFHESTKNPKYKKRKT